MTGSGQFLETINAILVPNAREITGVIRHKTGHSVTAAKKLDVSANPDENIAWLYRNMTVEQPVGVAAEYRNLHSVDESVQYRRGGYADERKAADYAQLEAYLRAQGRTREADSVAFYQQRDAGSAEKQRNEARRFFLSTSATLKRAGAALGQLEVRAIGSSTTVSLRGARLLTIEGVALDQNGFAALLPKLRTQHALEGRSVRREMRPIERDAAYLEALLARDRKKLGLQAVAVTPAAHDARVATQTVVGTAADAQWGQVRGTEMNAQPVRESTVPSSSETSSKDTVAAGRPVARSHGNGPGRPRAVDIAPRGSLVDGAKNLWNKLRARSRETTQPKDNAGTASRSVSN